jgi:hypothetical protein
MLKKQPTLMLLGMLLCTAGSAVVADVSIRIGMPNVSIGINVPAYPQLVRVPGYPVYYAPGLEANFFFYDGLYWVYENDNWYASSWYNGPWGYVDPQVVPVFILRVPVRYYRQPPAYFRGGRPDAPPRWSEHWGQDWDQRRSGWDKREHAPAPAPLPAYQRQYSKDRYPRQVERQEELQKRNYRYQPREPVVQQHYQEQTRQHTRDDRAPAQQPPKSQGRDDKQQGRDERGQGQGGQSQGTGQERPHDRYD